MYPAKFKRIVKEVYQEQGLPAPEFDERHIGANRKWIRVVIYDKNKTVVRVTFTSSRSDVEITDRSQSHWDQYSWKSYEIRELIQALEIAKAVAARIGK